jgi:drug/metabolite transporter (DMT)-like permease
MSMTALALLAAASQAISTLVTKRMVGEYPARQLIGPLLALNSLLAAPFLIAAHWHLSWSIALIQLVSVAALVTSSWCVFELFVHGSASAVSVGQAMAPIPAVIFRC